MSSTPSAAWARILDGCHSEDLGISLIDGRFDLRGLSLALPVVDHNNPVGDYGGVRVSRLTGTATLRGVTLRNIDFSGAVLPALRMHGCMITGCKFDGANCEGWRLWSTEVRDTTFEETVLRDTAMGAISTDGHWNVYSLVKFDRADLRGSSWVSADVRECSFAETKLKKVDFQGTNFCNCVFSGPLEGVLFYRTAFRGEALPPNEMSNVDLQRTTLAFTEFRGLDLRTVRFPNDNNHLVVAPYKEALDDLIERYAGATDPSSHRLMMYLRLKHKWMGTHQERGVVSKSDLLAVSNESMAQEVWAYLAANYGAPPT